MDLDNLETDLNGIKEIDVMTDKYVEVLLKNGYSNGKEDSELDFRDSIIILSNSIFDNLIKRLEALITKNDDAKEAEITDLLRQPLEEQQKLQGELAKLLAEIQTE